MSKHNDNVFRRVVTNGLKKQHTAGVAQGAYAIGKVLLDKAKDESKSVEQRLADVISFCEICVRIADKSPEEESKVKSDEV